MTIHDTEDWSSPGGQGPAQVIGDPILPFGTLLLGEDPSGNAQAIQVDSSGNVLTTGGYASLTGAGQSTSPGELDQAGAFTVSTSPSDAVGFRVVDTGTGGIVLSTVNSVGINGLTGIDLGDSVVVNNSGGTGLLRIVSTAAGDGVLVNLSGATSTVDIGAEGGIFIGDTLTTTVIKIVATSQVLISGGSSTGITIGLATSDLLGFYAKPGVARQARPVTLADVITVLANLGLTA